MICNGRKEDKKDRQLRMILLVKKFFLLSLLLINTFHGEAQNKKNKKSTAVEQVYKPFIIEIKKKDKQEVNYYSNIIIKDARVDSTLMGVTLVDLKSGNLKLVFEKNAEEYLTRKFNGMIESRPGMGSLYLLIRDIWLNQTRSRAGWMKQWLTGSEHYSTNLFLNIEFYALKDSLLFHVGKLDSVFTETGWLPDNADKLITKTMRQVLKLGDSLCSENPGLGGISLSDLNSKLSLENKYPAIYQEYKQGIYLTFSDFLFNHPSTSIPFETEEKIHGKSLKYDYGTWKDTAWGFSDSTGIYMHLDKYYYLLKRRQNTFEVVAPETIEIINTFQEKALSSFFNYFLYENPFKIFALEPFTKPGVENFTYLQLYHLNLLNGNLR